MLCLGVESVHGFAWAAPDAQHTSTDTPPTHIIAHLWSSDLAVSSACKAEPRHGNLVRT